MFKILQPNETHWRPEVAAEKVFSNSMGYVKNTFLMALRTAVLLSAVLVPVLVFIKFL